MGTLTKTFVILNLVFSIAFVTVSATVLSQRANWKKQALDLEEKLKKAQEDSVKDKDFWRQELDKVSKARDGKEQEAKVLEVKVAERERTIQERDLSIQKYEKDVSDANTRTKVLADSVDRLSKDLLTSQGDVAKLKDEATGANKQMDKWREEVVGYRSAVAERDLKLRQLLDRVNITGEQLEWWRKYGEAVAELAPDADKMARGEQAPRPTERIRAVVKAVSAEQGLVVLNVGAGRKDPVRKGYRFLIYRGGNFIAAVQVVNVEKDMCATEVVLRPKTDREVAVQVGDEAISAF